jgi:predicted  nucleic acid-binding Zn-ribbon protein
MRIATLLPLRLVSVSALALSTVLSLGCGEVKKAGECSAIIDAINEATAIEPKGGKGDDLSGEIKAMEDWDAKVAKVEVTDEGLKKRVGDYRDLVKSMAENLKALDKINKGLDKITDPAQAEKLSKEVDALEKKIDAVDKDEEKIVSELNKYCGRN